MIEEISSSSAPDRIVEPEEFGDDWSVSLELEDVAKVREYVQAIRQLEEVLDWINFHVGVKDHTTRSRSKLSAAGLKDSTGR